MIKVLIADDEAIIRKGLKNMILSYDLNLEVIGEASDGEMALTIIKEHKPDIMLIDINMPFLNGLDFLEIVKDLLPDTITIIISGYDEFEFARRALQLGAFDYLLKPLNRSNLYQCIKKAVHQYNNLISKKHLITLSQKEIQENEMLIQQNILRMCLENEMSPSFIEDKLKILKFQNTDKLALFIINDKAKVIKECLVLNNLSDYIFVYSLYIDSYLILICKLDNREIEEILNHLNKNWIRDTGNELECSYMALENGIFSLYKDYKKLLHKHTSKSKLTSTINWAINYIKENYNVPDINLQLMADKCYVSPSCLTRALQQTLGLSFSEYLTEVRLSAAMELLSSNDPNLSINEVARKVGYSSQHYFSRIFKSKTGFSPTEYRGCQARDK